jgi:hypothetical protein
MLPRGFEKALAGQLGNFPSWRDATACGTKLVLTGARMCFARPKRDDKAGTAGCCSNAKDPRQSLLLAGGQHTFAAKQLATVAS